MQLDRVTVTVQRREENQLDVPGSVDAFGQARLDQTGITRLDQIQAITPGLKLGTGAGSDRVTIRGVGNNVFGPGSEASAAIHFDGVYLPRAAVALFDLYDLQRVEILKGPQGTLYGKNATAGILNIVTAGPADTWSGQGYVGAGSFGRRRAEAVANLPFEGGGIRISADYGKDNGYTQNIGAGGTDLDAINFRSVRAKGRYAFSSDWQATVMLQLVRDDGTIGYGNSNNPATDNFASTAVGLQRRDPRRIDIDTPVARRQDAVLSSWIVDGALGGGLAFKSTTGYVYYKSRDLSDSDGTGAFIEYGPSLDRSRFVSQEFRLAGDSSGAWSWSAGIYGSRELGERSALTTDADFPDPSPYTFSQSTTNATSTTLAAFGQADYRATPELTVTAGARATRERKSGRVDGAILPGFPLGFTYGDSLSTSNFAFTPKLGIEYALSRKQMVYASITRGFKAGGLNLASPAGTYGPEKVWAYEVGTKGLFFSDTLESSLALFHYDYRDLQLRTAVYSAEEGASVQVTNAAKAPVTGVDATFVLRPARGLSFDLNGEWLLTRLQNFVPPGQTDPLNTALPLSPRWSGAAGASFQHGAPGGTLTWRAEITAQSSIIFPQLLDPAIERQGGYGLVNASVRWQSSTPAKTYVALIGRNLTDRVYTTDHFYYRGFSDLEFYGAPRTVELRLGTSF